LLRLVIVCQSVDWKTMDSIKQLFGAV